MISDPEIAERLANLDARDKLLRQQMTKQTELSQAQDFIGTCQDMCPERERCLRIGSSLSLFERDEQNQPSEFSMVKEYRRAGADQAEPLPHDLRTPEALNRTMNYLCNNIMDDPRSKTQELALHWYDFLWDRLRAIRKDITQQNICDQASAILVERCTRFHIHSCYAMNYVKDFDVDMNKRNLNDCLQMLRQMYTDLRNIGIRCEGELEFQKYDILLHLEEDLLSSSVAMKTSEHRSSADMKYVTQLFFAYTNNYYYKFFKLMEEANYMTSCILSLYVNKVRLNALKIIIASCTSKQPILYPANLLIETLVFDDLDDLTTFASCLGIGMQEKGGKYFLVLSKDLINVIRQTGTNLPPLKSIRLVESKKLNSTVGRLVYSQPDHQIIGHLQDSPTDHRFTVPIQNGHIGRQFTVAIQNSQPNPRIQSPSPMNQSPSWRKSSPIAYLLLPKSQVLPPPMSQAPSPISQAPSPISQAQSSTSLAVAPISQVATPIPQAPSFTRNSAELTIPLLEHQLEEEEEEEEEAIPSQSIPEQAQSPNEITSEELQDEIERAELIEKSRKVAVELPICRLRFRKQPRFHPFEPTPEKKEKPKQKRTSFYDSIRSLKDEVSDEMKANESLMKIIRTIS